MATRGGNGRYTRSHSTAARDAEACCLRAQNLTYQQIGDELGISKSQAYEAVQRALKDTLQEPADEVRKLELLRLDELAQQARKVMLATHYVISHGTVVRLTKRGRPLEDDGPVLQAIDRLLRIQERRARLLGLDSPQRVSIDAQQLGEDLKGLISALTEGDDDDDLAEDEEPDDTDT